MLALEKWSEGRDLPLAMLSQLIAANAETLHDLVHLARRKFLLSVPQARGITRDAWLRMYRRPTAVRDMVWQLGLRLGGPDNLAQTSDCCKDARRSLNAGMRQVLLDAIAGQSMEKMRRLGQRVVQRYFQKRHLPMIAAMLRDDVDVGKGHGWLEWPEFIFFLAVAVPCWVEYHTTPWRLYRQAVRGNSKALEHLVRLDPYAMQEKHLGQVLFDLGQKNPRQLKRLHRASSEGVKTVVKIANIKYMLGGLIMKLSDELQQILHGELWIQVAKQLTPADKQSVLIPWEAALREKASRLPVDCRLKAPDIHKLFNAVALDAGKGLIDKDFKGLPNSIYKRLKHKADSWPSLWKADKTRAA